MIVRTWSGRVPSGRSDGFTQHLLATGVADYSRQPECRDVLIWRAERNGWTVFTVVSVWDDMDAIHRYAGDTPDLAVLYPGDEIYGLDPDRHADHFELVAADPRVAS